MKKKESTCGTKVSHVLALLPVLTAVFFISVCSSCGSRNTSEPDSLLGIKPSRNCQQEYDQLIAKKFYTLREAKSATLDFLAYFTEDGQCPECCEKVRQMEGEFIVMDDLFSNVENSGSRNRYCSYIQMVRANGDRFSRSSFEAVRKTWKYLTDEKSDLYMRERLNLIDKNDFTSYLVGYAKDLAVEWYGGGGPAGWIVKDWYILNNEMGDVVQVDGQAAKRCSCTVHVNMEGAMGLGLRSGSVEIWVEGTLGIAASSCEVFFSKGGYSKTNVEGGLRRRG